MVGGEVDEMLVSLLGGPSQFFYSKWLVFCKSKEINILAAWPFKQVFKDA